jgi:hypothetical protein
MVVWFVVFGGACTQAALTYVVEEEEEVLDDWRSRLDWN